VTGVIERFAIHVDDAVLDDLRARLAMARLPDQIPGTGWEQGFPTDYLRELVDHSRDRYDWRAQEARLNELAHFRTTIDGQSIHFVHARSAHGDARPLLLVHGWPGSIVEFGGHFAAMEQPELFVDDLRDFFRTVRTPTETTP